MSDDKRSVGSITSVASGSNAVEAARDNPSIEYICLEDFHCRAPKIYNTHSLVCGNLLKTCCGYSHGNLQPDQCHQIGTYHILRGRDNTTFCDILADICLSAEEEKTLQERISCCQPRSFQDPLVHHGHWHC